MPRISMLPILLLLLARAAAAQSVGGAGSTPETVSAREVDLPPAFMADGRRVASPDEVAVARAAADYVASLYEVRPELVERSVHPQLSKRGIVLRDGEYRQVTMTYEQLRDIAARWNANGRVEPATAVREIIVFDVLDHTATAKVVAAWGVDYLHVARYGGEWKIINVLWQAPPVTGDSAGERGQDEDAVRNAVDAFFEAMRSRDEERLRSAALPGARLVNPIRRGDSLSVRVLTMDQLAGMAMSTAEPYDERMADAEVRIDGDLATVWGRYTFRVGRRLTNCGTNAVQLLRTPDGWRIAHFASTIETAGC